jgi:uncharacterized Rmd1/YagE family protein
LLVHTPPLAVLIELVFKMSDVTTSLSRRRVMISKGVGTLFLLRYRTLLHIDLAHEDQS